MSQDQPQSTAQPSTLAPAPAQAPQTAQEVLQNLDREYQERIRELNVVRESLTKSQEAVISSQEAAFKAYQLLTINKERYLVNIIGQHQNQANTYAQELSKLKQLYLAQLKQQSAAAPALPTFTPLPTIPEAPVQAERDDNLSSS